MSFSSMCPQSPSGFNCLWPYIQIQSQFSSLIDKAPPRDYAQTMTEIKKPKLLWSCEDTDRQKWHGFLCWAEPPGTMVFWKCPALMWHKAESPPWCGNTWNQSVYGATQTGTDNSDIDCRATQIITGIKTPESILEAIRTFPGQCTKKLCPIWESELKNKTKQKKTTTNWLWCSHIRVSLFKFMFELI